MVYLPHGEQNLKYELINNIIKIKYIILLTVRCVDNKLKKSWVGHTFYI